MAEATLPIVRTVPDLRAQVRGWKAQGLRIALVPTMGALHAGHISLIDLARRQADRVVASIFVNPTQFGPNEDFERYPRNEERDAAALAGAGCDLLFAPTVAEMYAPGFATTIHVGGVAEPLEGAHRPTHFAGVATVVAKLLIQAEPDIAIFGEKDYQQLQVIRRLALDLDIPTAIIGAPIARAEDGLALSSRNAYLSPSEREIAAALNRVLNDAAAALHVGEAVAKVEGDGTAALVQAGFDRVDYFAVCDADTLAPRGPGPLEGRSRILAAASLGKTRLIDNIAV